MKKRDLSYAILALSTVPSVLAFLGSSGEYGQGELAAAKTGNTIFAVALALGALAVVIVFLLSKKKQKPKKTNAKKLKKKKSKKKKSKK